MRHGIVSHASCAIGRGRTRRWGRSIENWPPNWAQDIVQFPIIRSERSITGALCCAAWVRPRLSTGFCPPCSSNPSDSVYIRGFTSLYPKEVVRLVYLDASDYGRTAEELATVIPTTTRPATTPALRFPD